MRHSRIRLGLALAVLCPMVLPGAARGQSDDVGDGDDRQCNGSWIDDGSRVLVAIVEKLPDGHLTVLVPMSPTPGIGVL